MLCCTLPDLQRAIIVQPRGLWINLGPLLYHWADAHTYLQTSEVSIELCLEDVQSLAASFGLEMIKEEMVTASFNQDIRCAALRSETLVGPHASHWMCPLICWCFLHSMSPCLCIHAG